MDDSTIGKSLSADLDAAVEVSAEAVLVRGGDEQLRPVDLRAGTPAAHWSSNFAVRS